MLCKGWWERDVLQRQYYLSPPSWAWSMPESSPASELGVFVDLLQTTTFVVYLSINDYLRAGKCFRLGRSTDNHPNTTSCVWCYRQQPWKPVARSLVLQAAAMKACCKVPGAPGSSHKGLLQGAFASRKFFEGALNVLRF